MALIPPEGWEPKGDQKSIRDAVFKYRTNPELFDEDSVDDLETNASHFRIPFARSEEHQDAAIFRFIKQAAQGWSEGFTTLPPEKLGFGSEPKTTGEGIARNLGHLAGFIGYLPGRRWMPALKALQGRSVPMAVAGAVQRRVVKKVNPMLKEMGPWALKASKGNLLSDMASGAFHLGVASGVSSWTHGVDEIIKSSMYGAGFGAAFRGIGNLPGFGNKLKAGSQIDMATGMPVLKTLSPGQKADLGIRTMAGSVFQGLPSTLQGATTEEQVYNYIMGGYFGLKEQPFQTRKSREFLIKSMKDKTGPIPKEHPEYEGLTEFMKEIVDRDHMEFFGPEESRNMTYDLLSGGRLDIEDIEKLAENNDVDLEGIKVDPVTGEKYDAITRDTIQKYRDDLVEKGAYEDMGELDSHIAKIEDLAKSGQPLVSFVQTHLKGNWEKEDHPEIAMMKIAADVNQVWKGLHYTAKDGYSRPKKNANKEMEEYFAETHGTTLNEEQSGWWRAFYEQNRRKKPVQLLTMEDGVIKFMDGPTNALGNRKDLHFEPPLIEGLFKRERAETGNKLDEPFYTYLDHMIFKGREYELFKAPKDLARDMFQAERNKEENSDFTNYELRQYLEKKAKGIIDKSIGQSIQELNSHGYYYLGGKGDAKRMYFVKYHPKLKNNDPFFKNTKKLIKEAYGKLPKDHPNYMTGEQWDKYYKSGKQRFLKSLALGAKDGERIYDKSMLSNYLYDITFNGFEIKPNNAQDLYSSTSLSEGFQKVIGSGYINNAKGYNKRAQIWFNTGLSATPEYISERVLDTDGRAFNVRIFSEAKTPQDADGRVEVGRLLNSEQAESTDGGLIGRSDVVDSLNSDKGLPTSGGVNKSFIVSPDPKDGALLGKYMIHTASPELEKWMHEENVHILAPESGIKQLGERVPESLKYDESTDTWDMPLKDYKVPIYAFRTIMSEKTSEKYIKPQNLPKQMYSTLSAFGSVDGSSDVIKAMYADLSRSAMLGTPEANELIRKWEKSPKNETAEALSEKLDEIPIPKLMSLLRDPNGVNLATKLYKKLLRHNDDMLAGLAEEGEISKDQYAKESKVNQEFSTALDRLLQLYPEGNIGAYLHKFSRDYRMVAIRNFIVNRLTRPKIDNSAVSRMRPMDPAWLVKDEHGQYKYPMGELEVRDDIFFLDNGMKQKIIRDPVLIKGRERLGHIWEDLKGGKYEKNKDYVEEIFNSAVMRVPMDSMSGTNILKFKGFTGVKGYGVLLHSRAMRALGGADLDGDKAFIFFGGEGGLKKEYKDMYGSQREEFTAIGRDAIGNKVHLETHNKNEKDLLEPGSLREQFIKNDPEIKAEGNTPYSYYDPYWRHFMSEGAATGRDVLGLAVTQRSAIIGAYNAIRGYTGKESAEFMVTLTNSDGIELKNKKGGIRKATAWLKDGVFSMPFADKNGNIMRVEFKTKTDAKSLRAFRQRARTLIALGSDPMDEAGLQDPMTFSKKLMDPLFEYTVRSQKGQVSKVDKWWTTALRSGDPKAQHLVGRGLQRLFAKVNSVVYSKNYQENRRWSFAEIQAATHSLDFLPEQSRNTLLPMLSKDIAGLNWTDNMFRRVDFPMLKALYLEHQDTAKKEDWMKEVLDRKTLGTPMGKLIEMIMERKLYTPDGAEKLSRDKEGFEKLIDEKYGKAKGADGKYYDLYTVGEIPWGFRPRKTGNPDYRRAFIEHLVLKAEDYIVNDLSDMVTLKRITEIIKKNKLSNSEVSELHKMSEYIKDLHYMKSSIRKSNEGETKDFAWREEAPEGIKIEDFADSNMAQDKSSVKADQIIIDQQIREYKKDMSAAKEELFDTFLLGTFQRGNTNKVQELRSQRYLAPQEQEILELLEKQSKNTALSRVALNSPSVADINIRRFFEEYNNLFKKVGGDGKVDLDALSDGIVAKEKVVNLKDGDGKRWEGQIIEEADLSSKDNKYLDEVEPFRGLTKGAIKDPELKEIYLDLKAHLETTLHNSDAKNINFLFRGIIGKNMNKGDKQDWKVFRNYLDELNTPTFWRKSWDFILGKKTIPEIQRVYYASFPATIDRNLQKSPAMRQLKDTIGPYEDRLGNTIMGKIKTPVSPIAEIQQFSGKSTEISMAQIEQEKGKLKEALAPYVSALPEGDAFFDMAIAIRERGMIQRVLRQKTKNPLLTHDEMVYEQPWKEIREAFYKMRDKNFKVVVGGKVNLLTGGEVITNINKIITKQNEVTHRWLVGNPKSIDKWLSIAREGGDKETWKGLDKLRMDWFKYNEELIRTGKPLPIEELGIDGVRQIGKRIIGSFIPEPMRKSGELQKLIDKIEITSNDMTGELPFETYFPHINFDRNIATANLDKAIETITKQYKNGEIELEERDRTLKRLMTHYRQVTGDWLAKDEMSENFDAMQEVLQATAEGRKKKAQNILSGGLKKVGNQFSRKAHLGGWDRSPEAYDNYMKQILDSFYKQSMQIQNRIVIQEFGKRFIKSSGDAKLTNSWQNFFKLYAQSAMGYPSHIPETVMNDSNMKLKMTPYKWFADSQTKKRVDFIRKKLGIGRKMLKKWGLDKKTIDELSGVSYGTLNNWSAMEAKYQLASLLAHPKSSIANLYGGTVHTVINSGYQNWRNARSFEYLKTHINPEWKGMEDVERWLQNLGVTEEFLIYEAGLNPNIKSQRYENFVKDVAKKLKKDPSMADKTLLELKRKHKLTETMWNAAASFMRVPERVLRRDAFMSHYLQAREKFGNAIKDYDHPFLIEMAKKGVKATQFLYSAPYRPMWTNSALGRVFSRFQLWSWNSVRFRNDTIREVQLRGVMPGTEAFDRMVRLAQADAFMLAMSNLFLYSLFESALPAPYNWFQDTADWLMGDDTDKERAFYGSVLGPAQMIAPPSMRLVSPMFKWLLHGDSERLTDYYLWTMLPFGRIIRDIWGPGGALENPYYAVTKVSGIPISQIGKTLADESAYNPRGY